MSTVEARLMALAVCSTVEKAAGRGPGYGPVASRMRLARNP
jgi:hypothetical protein